MRFPDYGKCNVRSAYLAQKLEKEGIASIVAYGIYKPLTLRESWDERWQQAKGREFVHFWLLVDKLIYDYSAFQFGEKERIKTHHKDKRYEQLGNYDYKRGELIHIGETRIEWESLYEFNGIPTVRVVT